MSAEIPTHHHPEGEHGEGGWGAESDRYTASANPQPPDRPSKSAGQTGTDCLFSGPLNEPILGTMKYHFTSITQQI